MNTKTQDYIEPVKELSNRVSAMQSRVCDTAKRASQATDRYVRDNPWQTVAMVAIAACMAGWIFSSLRD